MSAYRRRIDDPASIAACIRCFEPRSVDAAAWSVVEPWVRETVTLSGPTLHSQAANALKVLSRFALWAVDEGMVLDRESVLTPEAIDRYRLVGMRALAPTSRSAEVSRLRHLARAVTKKAPWPAAGAQGSRQGLSPPYTGEEIAGYWQAAGMQNGPFRVQAMKATLALTVGAGARSGELFAVTADDIIDVDGIAAVRLGSVPARVVPVRAAWADRLQTAVGAAGVGPLIGSRRVGRDQASALLASFEYPGELSRLMVPRLRSTWLSGVLTDCGVAEVFSAAGITTGKALSDLLPYLPAPQTGSPGWRRLGGYR